ncbi:Putative MFS multidrug resistance transporter [Aspergillus calidoustus]|uniref:Putative MFS multidrug resistance transporter n=1 Tax=Aspergillus calidoustus TaxID=454130 RepID=A0A0U4ZTW0_ASPCI|nr:Putative MFS multidrug resistance transporter [Aspergillus calidoustus]
MEEKSRENPQGPQHELASTVSDDDHSISQASDRTPTVQGKDAEDRVVVSDSQPEDDLPVVVPRLKRRGLLAQLTLLEEVENPKTYPRNKKWFITFIVAVAGSVAPFGSAIFLPALTQVSGDLGATSTITNLTISLYMLAMAVFPIFWSSFSERLGRRTVYLASFCLFVIFNVLCAVSTSIGMLIILRLLSGGASSSVQAVGAGTIADIWDTRERGHAMSIFYLGPLAGPLIAPIIGGALAQRWHWRATMWFFSAYGGCILVLIIFGLPETLLSTKPLLPEQREQEEPIGRRLSRVSSRQVIGAAARWLKLLKVVFIDPLKIILYLRYVPVLLTVYYAAITFGLLYVLNISIEHSFVKDPYNFDTLIVGLLYIPNSLGYFISSIFGGKWIDNIMIREAKKANRYDENGKLIYRPEDRMRENAVVGALLYPAGLIWYGWTVEKGVFWIAPMIANFFFGVGSMLIFAVVTTMLTEMLPRRSSEGVALNNFVRNIFSCVGSFVTVPVINGIGNGWLFTIAGFAAFASSLVIVAMRHFGGGWRDKMDSLMQ